MLIGSRIVVESVEAAVFELAWYLILDVHVCGCGDVVGFVRTSEIDASQALEGIPIDTSANSA